MVECKAATFPFLLKISLEDGESTPLVDSALYWKLIGSLLYLIDSRNDIYYAMNFLSRHMQQSHDLHWKSSEMIV